MGSKWRRLRFRRATFALLILVFINSMNLGAYTDYEISRIFYSNSSKITNTINTLEDQNGIIRYLDNIMKTSIWVDFAYRSNYISLGSEIKLNYLKSLDNKVKEFNKKFSDASGSKYVNVKLTELSTLTTYDSNYFSTLESEIGAYYQNVYKKINNEIKDLSGTSKTEALDKNRLAILYIYSSVNSIASDIEFINTVKNAGADANSVYKLTYSNISKALDTNTFGDILSYASSSKASSINSSIDISVSKTNDALSKFMTTDSTTGEIVATVNNAYLAVIAASSVYVPLESKLGDTNFKDALNSITGDDSDIYSAYSKLAYDKKPVYFIKLVGSYDTSVMESLNNSNKYGDNVGDAELLTVDKLRTILKDVNNSYIFITMKGSMILDDQNSYLMSTKNTLGMYQSGTEAGTYVNNDKDKKEEDKKEDDKDKDKEKEENNNESVFLGDKSISLDDKVTDSEFFSSPFLVISNKGFYAYNKIALSNIMKDYSEKSREELVYVNAFGDLILSSKDNTVLFPSSANAGLYQNSSEARYYPFTEAFSYYYPTFKQESKFKVDDNQKGKYFISFKDKEELEPRLIITGSNKEKITYYKVDGSGSPDSTFCELGYLETGMYDPSTASKNALIGNSKVNYSFFSSGFKSYDHPIFFNTNLLAGEGIETPIYPATEVTGVSKTVRNKYIANSYYASIMMNEDGTFSDGGNNRLSRNIMYNMLTQICGGKPSTSFFEESVLYNDVEDDNVFIKMGKFVGRTSATVMNLFGNVQGTLGLENAAQNPIMGNILYISRLLISLIAVILSVVVLYQAISKGNKMIFVLFKICLVVVVVIFSIYVVPKYMGNITNFLTNDLSNELGFRSIMHRQELALDVNEITFKKGDISNPSISNANITIYAFKEDELKSICSSYDVDYREIATGGILSINESTGVYIQGSYLKMNLDKMFSLSTIVTSGNVQNTNYNYSIEIEDTKVNLLDHYTPYSLIKEGLVGKLNNLSKLYELKRNQIKYLDGKYKDAFFMTTYINSPMFLAPGDFKLAEPDIQYELLEAMTDLYSTNYDFLGISDKFKNAIDGNEYDNTLWYNTLVQNGYTEDNDKMNFLISYVNENTRLFIIKNSEIFNSMSDENIIEIVSLYSSILFNNQVGEYFNKLYPGRLNYEELTIIDSLKPVIIKNYNKLSEVNRDLADYIFKQSSAFGSFLFAVSMIFQGISGVIMNYSIYILYLSLLIFITIKIFTGKNTIDKTMKGFFKLSSLIVSCFIINILSLDLISKLEGDLLSVVILLVESAVILTLSLTTVFYFLTSLTEMDLGNSKFDAKISKIGDNLSNLFKLSKFNSRNSYARNLRTRGITIDRYRENQRGYTDGLEDRRYVDLDRYNRPRRRRRRNRREQYVDRNNYHDDNYIYEDEEMPSSYDNLDLSDIDNELSETY